MENINPCLLLCFHLKRSIEKGVSVRLGILEFIRKDKSEFSQQVMTWLTYRDRGAELKAAIAPIQSMYRKNLLYFADQALSGQSIYTQLCQFEKELIEACEQELQERIQRLPFIMLIPLLLLQFPAFLLLLFGPVLQQLLDSLR